MNCEKFTLNHRFAACAAGARLLSICMRAAGRVPASKSVSKVHLSAGYFIHVGMTPGLPNKTNLTRCKIFRGKVLQRKNQKPKNTSKPSPHRRLTYE
jgi:hypothetical protein